MSYEGYVKALCTVGHLSSWDAHDERDKACHCGESFVWWCHVDQTNCDTDPQTGLEPGDVHLEVAVPATYKTCPCCNHAELVEEERYAIPTNAGMLKVGNFVACLDHRGEVQVAEHLTKLGLGEGDPWCSFLCGRESGTCRIHLGKDHWPPERYPVVPEELAAEGLARYNERYEFNGGSFLVKVEDLLKCNSVLEIIDLVGDQDLGWHIVPLGETQE